MTNWGYILLVAFVALGVSERIKWRKAGRVAAIVTAAVMVFAFVNYHALR